MQTNEPGSLQNKFQDFGSAPSEQLWNNIAANLDEDKKRKGAFWWWFVGAAAIVVLFFGVYQLGYNAGVSEGDSQMVKYETPTPITIETNEKIPNPNIQSPNESNQQTEILSNQNNDEQNSETITNSLNENSETEKSEHHTNNLNIAENSNVNEIDVTPNHSVIHPIENNEPIYTLLNFEAEKFPPSEISKIKHSLSEPQLIAEPMVIIENPTPKNKWEMGFSVGTLKGFQSSNQNMLADSSASLTTFDNLDQNNSIEGTGISSFSNLSESQVNITRPLQLEMTIARDFGKRWNFQTGLSFGFLSSNNHYSSGSITNVRSRFLSIGIPIHLNYDIVQRQRFSFYSGFGANYEMPFFESVKTSYSVSALESTSTKDFTKGYMISGQLNVGFRYNLNQKLTLDFRPNLRYYIHQSMQSVYPALERKIWAGASLGLVWQL